MITPPSTNNNDTYNYARGSPHSPHTAPDPLINVQPEYSQQHSICSLSSNDKHLDYSSSTTTTNSPHTAALQYDSPNPNPQLGHVQLDFIPLPTTRPSAPPQPSTVPLPYVAPPTLAPSPPSVPYPVPPSANTQQQQPQYEVTFVDATPIDMSNEKYKMSAAAGGSTLIQDLRNPKKKAFWIFNIIFLAIIFGVLGATVWKRDSNDSNGSGDMSNRKLGATTSSSSSTRPVSSNSVPTRVVPVVPTPVIPTTPAPVPVPKPTSNLPLPRPTGGGSGGSWACDEACAATSRKCEDNCRATDSAYKSCNAKCSSSSDAFCESDCEWASGCFSGCNDVWGQCAMACG